MPLETFKCVICGDRQMGFGNNPAPIYYNGRCCGDCNAIYVIPARIHLLSKREKADTNNGEKK